VTKDLIVDTKMLAAFANLEPADADRFRNAVAPGFVPEAWWTGHQGHVMEADDAPTAIWQREQQRLRNAWRSQFPPEACVDLIVSATKMSEFEQWREADESNKQVAAFIPKPKIYPYQHVIMLLALQPWRARICEICGKYFVKDAPRDRYCSPPCTKQARLVSKRTYWDSNKKKLRPSKKKRGGK
jgi:hypothetical protein